MRIRNRISPMWYADLPALSLTVFGAVVGAIIVLVVWSFFARRSAST